MTSVLGSLLLGAPHGLWEHFGRYTVAAIVALLIVRYGISTRDDGTVFAAPTKT